MQSIYRFREAEVGLFLGARHDGLGGIELEPLTLSANFRSQADIVAWVNQAFEQVMPQHEDIAAGAVNYAPSDAVHPAGEDAVSVHAFFDGDDAGEAAQVAAIARAALNADDTSTVAVLVRARRNLEAIVPALKAAGLPFRAVEIETLGHRQVVQDLLALTRALNHLADRLAWLAVLRAPWCGLTLADLYALAATDADIPSPRLRGEGQGEGTGQAEAAESDEDAINAELRAIDAEDESPGKPRQSGVSSRLTIWELMHDEARLATLSAEGRARLLRLRAVLAASLANRQRASLRDAVESAWLALGGPACVAAATDLEDAEIYLDYLEAAEQAGALADVAEFEAGLAGLYALPDLAASERLQLMTIHKAKGLEFDTVILPGLGAGGRSDERELFIWMERPVRSVRASDTNFPSPLAGEGPGERGFSRTHGEMQLLIAPVNPTGSDKDKIYETIRRLEREKAAHETGRLLYVAATRAKEHLHLLGSVNRDDDGAPKPPAKGSLLEKLWEVVEPAFAEAARVSPSPPEGGEGRDEGSMQIDQLLRRLPANWQSPPPPASLPAPTREPTPAGEAIEYSWAGATAREVGSVAHLWLQKIAEDARQGWDATRIDSLRPVFRAELAARGVGETDLPAATERVATALANALTDERGRWLLGPQLDARNEYRLTAMLGGERRNLVIDRSFTDTDGRRWIVDYKTGGHEGANREAFLDSEQARYRAQLERYAAVHGATATQLGLYFPLLGGWRAWQKDPRDEPA
jgi:ATP-dependent exoDNAse (exonuclease V) beta subunit